MTVHAVTIDRSLTTSLVVCSCGLLLSGPFTEHAQAREAASEHRRWAERERQRNARQAAAREQAAEA